MRRSARRAFIAHALALPFLLSAAGIAAPPRGAIRLIIPFAAGGRNDTAMRILAEVASEALGRPIAVENMPGRRALDTLLAFARSPADGRQLAQLPDSLIRSVLLEGLPFEPARDLTPIIGLAGLAFGCIAKPDRFAEGWRSFLAEAREKPGVLSFGSPGTHSTSHLTMLRLLRREQLEVAHVPFRGASDGVRALIAGDIDVMAGPISIGEAVSAGEAVWLNVWSAQRLSRWPEAPTLVELGYRLVVTAPFGVVAPPALPPAAVTPFHDAFLSALRSGSFRAVLARFDWTEDYRDSQAYATFLEETAREYRRLIARLGPP